VTTIVDGVERAQLVRKTGKETTIVVHFNPASLQYTVTNTLENKGSGNSKKQYVTQSSGKLTFDLVFDTTHNGEDVRILTEQVAKLMQPEKKVPAVVAFEWGVYKFQGIVESYKETIDFFAPNGVPLRSAVNLTLSSQDKVFEPTAHGRSANTAGTLTPDAVEVPSSGGASGVGAQGGDPRAARGIAAANGQESLRFPAGDSFVVGDGVSLSPPVAFSSGGGGLGIGGGAGLDLGISGGAGIGISGGVGASAAFGGKASAGVSASAGAFAGLRAPAPERRFDRLSLDRLQPRPGSISLGTDRDASFQLGGRASVQGSASLRADVTGSARLRSRIQFDED
jgi:hypothetical protein